MNERHGSLNLPTQNGGRFLLRSGLTSDNGHYEEHYPTHTMATYKKIKYSINFYYFTLDIVSVKLLFYKKRTI